MSVVHAKKFVSHVCLESIDGPSMVEHYEALCGVRGENVVLTLSSDYLNQKATCKRCLRMLNQKTIVKRFGNETAVE